MKRLAIISMLVLAIGIIEVNTSSAGCRGNCVNGKGVMKWHSGGTYDGDWKNGKRNGVGIYTFSDGSTYEGEWKNNKMHGKGVNTFPDGTKINVTMKNGERVK